jgi:hypothetical protein
MTQSHVPGSMSPTGDVAQRERGPGRTASVPPAPTVARPSWTAGRITALVIGIVLSLASLGFLAFGGVGLWIDQVHRDDAGYVTTATHAFSTAGRAVVTEPIELGSPGVEWFYSTVVLGEVRIRVTPANPDATSFVGIGPSGAVDRYLAGVDQTLISDFWSDSSKAVAGSARPSAPDDQDFWVASATGPGDQTVTWDPSNGSWTVVVMNADAQPGVNITADLGAKVPHMTTAAVGSLVVGVALLLGGVILLVGSIRRVRDEGGRAR